MKDLIEQLEKRVKFLKGLANKAKQDAHEILISGHDASMAEEIGNRFRGRLQEAEKILKMLRRKKK